MIRFKPYFDRHYPKLERIIAVIALVNLALVFFDITYLSLRPTYRQYLTGITQIYDPLKGITPHPETQRYQAQVDQLNRHLAQGGPQSPQVEDSLLELQRLSQPLLTHRVFAEPHGEQAIVTLQQLLQERTGQPSGEAAFAEFWGVDYLNQRGWQQELAFWDSQMRPFFQANYYRRITPLGLPLSYFWLIDLPFMLVFASDSVLRIRALRRRQPALTVVEAALRRWYDLFLVLPFGRWLRVIPVSLRLYQVDLLNLEPVQEEAQRDVVVTVGADLAGIAGIEIIGQLQDSIRQGELFNWVALMDPEAGTIPPNGLITQEEITAIASQFYQVGIDNILAQVQPDIEALMQHSISKTLEQMPGYPQINHIPGLDQVSSQVLQGLSHAVAQGLYRSVTSSLLDAEGAAITQRLQHNLRAAIAGELSQYNTRQEIELRLVKALDHFKRDYIKALAETGGEKLAEHTEMLRKHINQDATQPTETPR
jgi:hypothetical protein